MTDRDRKLAELAELATGIRWGMAAFTERADEMGPGPSARGNGPGAKGQHSSPVEGQLERPPTVVTPAEFDRRLARAHAAVLDLEAAYGEIARTQRGIPSKGEPSCAWCAEAVHAAERVASRELAKARANGNEVVTLLDLAPIPLDYRSRTYLYAEERKGDKVVGKALTCEWCYRFSRREGHKPTIEERWIHAQGGRMPKKPVPPHKRRAERVSGAQR